MFITEPISIPLKYPKIQAGWINDGKWQCVNLIFYIMPGKNFKEMERY